MVSSLWSSDAPIEETPLPPSSELSDREESDSYDEAIFPRQQVTDEVQWGRAMACLREEFAADFSPLYPPESSVRLIGTVRQTSVKSGRHFVRWLEKLQDTESYNFGCHSTGPIGGWKYSDSKEGSESGEVDEPPELMFFRVGDEPGLPVMGRHFRECVTDASGKNFRAGAILRRVYRVLESFFPGNMIYWSEKVDKWSGMPRYIPFNTDTERTREVVYCAAFKAGESLVGVRETTSQLRMERFHRRFLKELSELSLVREAEEPSAKKRRKS